MAKRVSSRVTVDNDPLLSASADRIVYLCRKGVINHNQAFWRLCELFGQGRSLSEAETIELNASVRAILDGPSRKYGSDSRVIAARVSDHVVRRIDDFASAYCLTRSQCLGLALDLVYGQEWQLETEPWKRTKHIYAGETLPGLLNRLEHGSTTAAASRRSRGRSASSRPGSVRSW